MSRPKPRILEPDHQQISIRFDDPERTLAPDHLARALFTLVGRLDLSAFTKKAKAVEGHAGRPLLSVQMKLALWLYAISQGIGSAREIERLCESDEAFAWLTRGFRCRTTRSRRFASDTVRRCRCSWSTCSPR